ncbi:MAG: hypothetical protein H7328_07605 [Bdellovibrio sp.]|nr:hypothetical protein [Bdellovibrio sp.]
MKKNKSIFYNFIFSFIIAQTTTAFISTAASAQSCRVLFDSLQKLEPISLALIPAPPLSDLQIKAQKIAFETPKLGAYSRITVGLNEGNFSIVSDSSASWLKISIKSKIGKEIEQVNQNDIKNYLAQIANENLSHLVVPRLHAYRGVDRTIFRDKETYYLEELMNDEKRKDLSLALIGQMLFETYAKKDSRLVQATNNGKPVFALLLNGKSPEVLIPGRCEGAGCGEDFSKIYLSVSSKPQNASKDQKQTFLYDMNGNTQVLNIIGRSPLERLIKSDEELLINAKPDELVPVESYFVAQHRPAGSTAFRIGETIYHFGGEGWNLYRGTEKVKGFLVSNPYLRHHAQAYASLQVPPFNVGVVMMIPKKHIDQFIASVVAEMAKPEDERIKFDYYKSNCNHVPLCHFRDAGISMGSPTGISGFSTSATARNIFLNPPYQVRSRNIYPLAGTELTEAQIRDLFPPLLYRFHTLKHDGHLLNITESEKIRWQTAHLLNVIKNNPEFGAEQVIVMLKKLNLDLDPGQIEKLIETARQINLITGSDQLQLTQDGINQLKVQEGDYILN